MATVEVRQADEGRKVTLFLSRSEWDDLAGGVAATGSAQLDTMSGGEVWLKLGGEGGEHLAEIRVHVGD